MQGTCSLSNTVAKSANKASPAVHDRYSSLKARYQKRLWISHLKGLKVTQAYLWNSYGETLRPEQAFFIAPQKSKDEIKEISCILLLLLSNRSIAKWFKKSYVNKHDFVC